MTIRQRLYMLSALVLVPALLGAAWGLYFLYIEKVEKDAENVRQVAQVLTTLIERELALREATLHALSVSPALAQGDLGAFHELAKAVALSDKAIISLSNTAGRELMVSSRLYQAKSASPGLLAGFREEMAADATVFSNLYFVPGQNVYRFGVQVPVMRGNRVIYYLTMESGAEIVQHWLAAGKLPAGWSAAVLDRNGYIMASTLHPAKALGAPAGDAFFSREGAKSSSESMGFDEGRAIVVATPVQRSGWTVVLGMPKVELYRAIVSTVEYALGAILLLFLIVVTAASLVGRSIARSIDELVRIARAMERGEKIAVPRTGLAETTLVAEQLVRASERILTANEVLEQRVREAVEETRLAHAALLDNQKLEALGRLTGGIAHDFNNLLQTINTSIEIGARASTDERVKSAMVLAGRAMQRATRVTRQLMTFARTAVSEQAVLDIRVAMKSLEELLAGALRRDIDTRIDLPADLGNIRVDPVQLELAVLNIALNARDAMPGSGLFAISGRNEHVREQNVLGLPAGDYVVLSFEDSGCGIAPEALPRVFEPFYTTKDVGKGTGLGLAQVYGFAKQSGGVARVESERGRGTRVDLVIPRTARGATEQADDRLRELPKVRQGQATVLLVEDDALIAEVMEPALKGAGFEVLTAATGAAGQEILRTRRVDIVFSDIVMPGGMSGTDLARYVEETHPGIPVVLATGYSDAVPRTSTMRILLKPYDLHSVVSALVDELRKRDANPAQPA